MYSTYNNFMTVYYEHVYSHRGNIKTVKDKITIKEKKEKKIQMKMR